jgi:cullin-5
MLKFTATAVCDVQDSEQYVEKLLELFHRFSLLVKDAFNDDPRFLTSRDMVKLIVFLHFH